MVMALRKNFLTRTVFGDKIEPHRQLAFALMFLLLTATQVSAQVAEELEDEDEPHFDFAVWLAAGYSDNIRRQEDAEQGNYQAIGLYIDSERHRERLETRFVSEIQYRTYSVDDLENEVIGNIDVFLNLEIIPDRFSWIVDDNFGQGRTDPFSGAGPLNNQNINVFSTGPLISLPLGQRTELSMSGLFTDYQHEETGEFDSQTTAAELGLLRQISRVTAFGIIVDSREVEYQDLTAPYTIRGAVLHYERELASGSVLAEYGRNELEVNNSTKSGPRARLEWQRSVTARGQLSLSASQEFTDAGAFFAFSSTDTLVTDRGDVLLTPSPLDLRRFEAIYEFSTPKTLFTIGVAASEERFDLDPTFDNDSTTVRLMFTRVFTPRFSVDFVAENVDADFLTADGDGGDRMVSLVFDYRLARRLSFQADLRTYNRNGVGIFDENRIELRLRYEPTRRQ
jgi:hypothetical protein